MAALSVILPVRDCEAYIDIALSSLRDQTFDDFELLVIDDRSQDQSPAIAERHARQDRRIRQLQNPGCGLVDALNHGLQQACAPIIARMDADDVAMPTRFERQMAHWAATPGLLVLGTATFCIDCKGSRLETRMPPTRPETIADALTRVNPMAHPSVIMDAAAVRAVGGYRPAYQLAEDYDLWLRLSERGPLANLPEPLLEYRIHQGRFDASRFSRQILSEIVARVVAMRRRSGWHDPSSHWHDIDGNSLAALNLDPSRVHRETARRALQMARQFRKAGHGEAFRDALGLAAAQPRHQLGAHLEYAARLARIYL